MKKRIKHLETMFTTWGLSFLLVQSFSASSFLIFLFFPLGLFGVSLSPADPQAIANEDKRAILSVVWKFISQMGAAVFEVKPKFVSFLYPFNQIPITRSFVIFHCHFYCHSLSYRCHVVICGIPFASRL